MGFAGACVKVLYVSGVEVDVVCKVWSRARGGGGEVVKGTEGWEIGSFELTFTSRLR